MKIPAAILCLLAFQVGCSLALNPGIKLTILQDGLEQAFVDITPSLEQEIEALQIPDASDGTDPEFFITNIQITSIEFPAPTITITTDGFDFEFDDVVTEITADWSYKYKEIVVIKDSGTLTAKDKKGKVTGSVVVSLLGGGSLPSITVQDVDVKLGDLSITIHGSLLEWIYDALISFLQIFFEGSVADDIATGIQSSLNSAINQLLLSIGLKYTIQDVGTIIYAVTTDYFLPNTWVDFGILTTFTAAKKPLAVDPFKPSTLPDIETEDPVQFFIDQTEFSSLIWLYYEQGDFNFDVTQENIPASSSIELDTQFIGQLVPNLSEAYPNNQPMEVDLTSSTPPTVEISSESVSLTLTSYWDFLVIDSDSGEKTEAFKLDVAVNYTGQVNLVTETDPIETIIVLKVSDFSVSITIAETSIGDFDTLLLNSVITEIVKDEVVPRVNEVGEQGIPLFLPTQIVLVDPQIILDNGYMVVSSNFTISTENTEAEKAVAESVLYQLNAIEE